MKMQDTIHQFRYYTEEQAKVLKEGLGLKMPPQTIAFCIQYYRDSADRDPYADELLMLDQLNAALENEIDSIAPTDLYTGDSFVAETYADIMAKRRVIDPHSPHPCTLSEALKMASIHLFSAGRNALPYRGTAFIPENMHDYPLSPGEDCISAPDAAYRLRILPTLGEKGQSGDLLVLLSPRLGQTQLQFQAVCESVLSKQEWSPAIRSVTNVHPAGLLRTLLEMHNGLCIALTAFSPLQTALPMTVMTDHYSGCRILRIDRYARESLLPMIRDMGITVSLFGEVLSENMYYFLRDQGSVEIDPAFLRSLFHYKAVKVTLPREKECAPIAHRTVTPLNCRYLASYGNAASAEVTLKNGILASAASSDLRTSPMRTALYTTMAPILTLAAQGIPICDQSLSIGVELPQNISEAQNVAAALSCILGIYRAQMELAIPAQAIAVRAAKTATVPKLTAFSTAKGEKALPTKLTKENSKIYCLTPDIRVDHPDFASLRRLIGSVAALSRDGEILSARVLVGESITTGLSKMSGNFASRLSDGSIAAGDALPLAVLIESDLVLSYPVVGVTVASQPAIPQGAILPIKKESVIWSEKPEIVILAHDSDADARTLGAILSARECNVHLHSPITDPGPLSRSLLGATALILCRNAVLPGDKRVRFAYTVMKTGGGMILSLDPQNQAEKDYISLPNGLDDAILQMIAPKNDKKVKKY